jgi:protein involved in temperature-dependent protein secretion
LALDGRKIILDLHFKDSSERITPLITVFFNGRFVWEDYLKGEVLSLPLESRVGKNSLQIVAVNRPVPLVKIEYK